MNRTSKLYQYDYVVHEKGMLDTMHSKHATGYVLVEVDDDYVLDEEYVKDLIVESLDKRYGYIVFRDTIRDMSLSAI